MTLLRRSWHAASRPRAFYESLEGRTEIGAAATAALLAGAVGASALAVLLIRLTESSGWLPLVLGVPALALPYLALISLLGGLMLMRPAGLDLRAWEIVLWAWVPAGFLGLSLLPIGLVAPLPTLIGGSIMLPLWHLWLVWSGTERHAVAHARAAVALYVVAVFGLPLGLVLFTLVVLSRLP